MHAVPMKKLPDRSAAIASALQNSRHRTGRHRGAGSGPGQRAFRCLRAGGRADFADHRPRHRHRRRQERAYRRQDRRDACLDRHARLLRASGRGQSRRSRHDRQGRCHHRHVMVGRKRRAEGHRRLFAALLHPADRDHLGRDLGAGARGRRGAAACRACRRPVRTALRRPHRRCCNSSSAMRSPSRCLRRGASRPTISAPSIPAASSAPA